MRFARVIVTAHDMHWLGAAMTAFCGYGTSVIGCDAEVGVEQQCTAEQTLDGRPGAAAMVFAFSYDDLRTVIPNRVGQCLLTCPTAAAFDGLPDAAERAAMGKHVRYFGDGFQKSKVVDQRRFWRVPVMEGFLTRQNVEEVRRYLEDAEFRNECADHNYSVAKRFYSYSVLRRSLRHLITAITGLEHL